MSKRQTITAKDQVTVALSQSVTTCPLCAGQLFSTEARILEHLTPRGLGGSDEVGNLRWVHKACADKKTNGNKATSAGGDIHKIAKVRRLKIARKAKAEVEQRLKRPKWRLKRKIDGSVVKVRTR